MKRKVIAFVLTVVLTFGATATVYAATPPFTVNVPKIPKLTITLPESVKNAAKNAAEKWLEEHPITITQLEVPVVTQSTFYHKNTVYNSRGRLQIRWNEVENAESYEIEITKADGTTKVYVSKNDSLIIYEKSDDFITECPKVQIDSRIVAASVKVRAIGTDGQMSKWSDECKISCNGIHSIRQQQKEGAE